MYYPLSQFSKRQIYKCRLSSHTEHAFIITTNLEGLFCLYSATWFWLEHYRTSFIIINEFHRDATFKQNFRALCGILLLQKHSLIYLSALCMKVKLLPCVHQYLSCFVFCCFQLVYDRLSLPSTLICLMLDLSNVHKFYLLSYQSINQSNVGCRHTTRPGAPALVSCKHDQKVHSWVVLYSYQ